MNINYDSITLKARQRVGHMMGDCYNPMFNLPRISIEDYIPVRFYHIRVGKGQLRIIKVSEGYCLKGLPTINQQ